MIILQTTSQLLNQTIFQMWNDILKYVEKVQWLKKVVNHKFSKGEQNLFLRFLMNLFYINLCCFTPNLFTWSSSGAFDMNWIVKIDILQNCSFYSKIKQKADYKLQTSKIQEKYHNTLKIEMIFSFRWLFLYFKISFQNCWN